VEEPKAYEDLNFLKLVAFLEYPDRHALMADLSPDYHKAA
jgi:hypothetical protein